MDLPIEKMQEQAPAGHDWLCVGKQVWALGRTISESRRHADFVSGGYRTLRALFYLVPAGVGLLDDGYIPSHSEFCSSCGLKYRVTKDGWEEVIR